MSQNDRNDRSSTAFRSRKMTSSTSSDADGGQPARSLPPLVEPELWVGRAPMRWLYTWTASFCMSTSLHGVRYLFERPQLWAFRVMWVIVVAFALLSAGFFMIKALEDFQNKVIVTESDTPGSWSDLQFPAVTVCSLNLARKSFFKSIGSRTNTSELPFEETEFGTTLIRYLFNGGDISEADENSISALMRDQPNATVRAGMAMFNLREKARSMSEGVSLMTTDSEVKDPRLDPYLLAMAAQQEVGYSYFMEAAFTRKNKLPVSKFHLLHAFFRTEAGFCSQVREAYFLDLNRSKSFMEFIKYPRNNAAVGVSLGRQSGLALVVDAETWDYGLSRDADEGFLVSVHNIGDYPITLLAQAKVGPGTNVDLGIAPRIETVTEAALSRFDPEQRLCYTDDEFRFRHFNFDIYRYSFGNCVMNAARTSVAKNCNCNISAFDGGCYGSNLTCYADIMANIHLHNESENDLLRERENLFVQTPCFSPCNDQKYSLHLTSSDFANQNQLQSNSMQYLCIVFRKLKVVCKTQFRNEALEEQYKGICRLIEDAKNTCLSGEPMVAGEFLPGFEPAPFNESIRTTPMSSELRSRIYKYVRENLVKINVFIRDTNLVRSVRGEKQPLIWFVANLGGLFGISMGASFVTFVEVVVFLVVLMLRCIFGVENDQFPEKDGPTSEEKIIYEGHLPLNAPWFDNQTDEQYQRNKKKTS